MPNIENIDTQEDKNKLYNLSGIEKTKEGVDISEKMKGLLGEVQKTTEKHKEANDNDVIGVAQERLGIMIEGDKEAQKYLIKILDKALNIVT